MPLPCPGHFLITAQLAQPPDTPGQETLESSWSTHTDSTPFPARIALYLPLFNGNLTTAAPVESLTGPALPLPFPASASAPLLSGAHSKDYRRRTVTAGAARAPACLRPLRARALTVPDRLAWTTQRVSALMGPGGHCMHPALRSGSGCTHLDPPASVPHPQACTLTSAPQFPVARSAKHLIECDTDKHVQASLVAVFAGDEPCKMADMGSVRWCACILSLSVWGCRVCFVCGTPEGG
jgi:hypothetical protein